MRGNFTHRKLSDEQVREIIATYETPAPFPFRRPTYALIGRKYGVSAVMIHKIISRKSRVMARG